MEERFIHYQESITSLNRAWRTICELEGIKPGTQVWAAAYRMTIIEYCKPFKKSHGKDKNNHSLPVPEFGQGMQELHDTLISLRDTVLAHSDLGPIDAKVVYGDDHEPFIIKNTLPKFPSPSDIKEIIEFVLDDLYGKESEYAPRNEP